MHLLDKTTVVPELARIAKNNGNRFRVEVSEDVCFATEDNVNWVSIGEVSLFPSPRADVRQAVLLGAYEWSLPSEDVARKAVDKARPVFKKNDDYQGDAIFKAFSESLQDVLRRVHLLYPVFDIHAISRFPLRQPITIVPDTTAVHQGALDFVAAFLRPWVRVKVPALVHMEVLAQVDNYLSLRREKKSSPRRYSAILRKHALSQGGQRALLRMEFTPGIESDRGDLGADPLRGVVTQASDTEDKNLGLQEVVRSFADRLIVETARRFQRTVRPDHPLYLLTSDQGMARMALSEGLQVFFFQSRATPTVFGRTVTGAPFHPFTSNVLPIPLPKVLWELAVSFGLLRVVGASGDELKVWGIGGEPPGAPWQPYHCEQDLLWSQRLTRSKRPPKGNRTAAKSETVQATVLATTSLEGWYKFSPSKMLQLVGGIAEQSTIQRKDGAALIGVKSNDTFMKYERFLRSGELVSVQDDSIVAEDSLARRWSAIARGDSGALAELLDEVPSFQTLRKFFASKGKTSVDSIPVPGNARPNYLAFGEAAGRWCSIGTDEIVATPSGGDNFVEAALAAYDSIRGGKDSEWVLTGMWLEALAETWGIHPIVARRLVEVSRKAETLKVYFEGSTPDTRFDDHRIWVLRGNGATPTIDQACLYRGDFLVSGTASVRISIRGGQDAS